MFVTGVDGPPAHYQPHRCRVTWVLPGSPSVDAAAVAVSAVPTVTTTERVEVIKIKHSQVIDVIQSKYHKT